MNPIQLTAELATYVNLANEINDLQQTTMRTKQDFEAQLNSNFSVTTENGTTTLTLIEVQSVIAPKTENGLTEPFSALFRADSIDHFPQGTYSIDHEAAGTLLLFITPIGPDDIGMRYEAVFT